MPTEVKPPVDLFKMLRVVESTPPPLPRNPKRRLSRGAGIALIFGLALLAALNLRWLASGHRAPAAAPAGAALPLPDAKLPLEAGGELSLSAQKGHPLVLVFFATWCGPCLEELPEVSRAFAELGPQRPLYALSVDGGSLDEAKSAVAGFRARHPNPLPVAFDQGVLADRYRVDTIPRTLVFDSEGKLAHTLDGPQDADSIIAAVRATR